MQTQMKNSTAKSLLHRSKCGTPENWSEGGGLLKSAPPSFPPLSHTRRIGGLVSAMHFPLVSQETVCGLLGSPPTPQDWAQLQRVNKIISQPFSLTPHVLSGQLVAHSMWLDCLHNMFHALINFIHTHYRLNGWREWGAPTPCSFSNLQFSRASLLKKTKKLWTHFSWMLLGSVFILTTDLIIVSRYGALVSQVHFMD